MAYFSFFVFSSLLVLTLAKDFNTTRYDARGKQTLSLIRSIRCSTPNITLSKMSTKVQSNLTTFQQSNQYPCRNDRAFQTHHRLPEPGDRPQTRPVMADDATRGQLGLAERHPQSADRPSARRPRGSRLHLALLLGNPTVHQTDGG